MYTLFDYRNMSKRHSTLFYWRFYDLSVKKYDIARQNTYCVHNADDAQLFVDNVCIMPDNVYIMLDNVCIIQV